MPSYQKLALNCNSRWRYKDQSLIASIQTLRNLFWFLQFGTSSKLERFIWGSIKLHPLYFGWELQLRGNFWQGPFSKDALFENGTKSHNFTNLFFSVLYTCTMTSRAQRVLVVVVIDLRWRLELRQEDSLAASKPV